MKSELPTAIPTAFQPVGNYTFQLRNSGLPTGCASNPIYYVYKAAAPWRARPIEW